MNCMVSADAKEANTDITVYFFSVIHKFIKCQNSMTGSEFWHLVMQYTY